MLLYFYAKLCLLFQANPTLELPTMVNTTTDQTLTNDTTASVTAPIATDIVPPDDLFDSDDID